MSSTHKIGNKKVGVDDKLGEIDSVFRLIIVAGLRAKQLLRGSKPRIAADPKRRRNTSIALQEVRLGLVNFSSRKKHEPEGVEPVQAHTPAAGLNVHTIGSAV